jgi:alkyl hydroperoxide reductase subunit AhpC
MLSIGATGAPFDLTGVRKGQTGRYRLTDYRGRWLVLFFYPADFSFVCPTEVTGFQRTLPEFAAASCEVLGVSIDPPETHVSWARELGGIDYPLLSDTERVACRAYDVLDPQDGRALRASFVMDPQGVIEYAVLSHRNVGRSVEETLRVLQALQTGRSCPADWKPGDPTGKGP